MFESTPPKRKKNKVKAKNIFSNIPLKTSAFQWKLDQTIKAATNPIYQKQMQSYLLKDKKMLEKRRHGKVLKNLAFEKDLEIKNRKIDKELRRDLY